MESESFSPFTPLLQDAPVFRLGRNGMLRILIAQKKLRPLGRGVTGFTPGIKTLRNILSRFLRY
jgi:hypothetical protein